MNAISTVERKERTIQRGKDPAQNVQLKVQVENAPVRWQRAVFPQLD